MENVYEKKFMTGVPAKERWFFWAMIVFVLWSVGPFLEVVGQPVFIGPFPLLFWHELLSWVVSVILCWIGGYKLCCTQIDDIEAELLAAPEEDAKA